MTTSSLLLRLWIVVGLLAISATARPGRPFHPCQTLIFFSSYQNPSSFSGPRSITVFFTEIRPSIPTTFHSRPIIVEQDHDHNQPLLPLYSSVSASFRDRTTDILRVVGSLLFGVGCGALTAATLYLVWSLFAPPRFSSQDDEDDFSSSDDDDDVSVMKKAGYVAIPSPSPAKEVV